MKNFSTFPDMKKYKIWTHKIGSWKYLYIWRLVLPGIPQAYSALFLLSTLNSFQEMLKISNYSSTWT